MSFKDFINYLGLLFKKLLSFWGAVSGFGTLLLFIFGNNILPDVFPAFFLAILLLLFVLILNGYSVWADQVKARYSLEKENAELKATIPNFSVKLVYLRKYSIQRIIEKYEAILEGLERESEPKVLTSEVVDAEAVQGALSPFTRKIAPLLASVRQMAELQIDSMRRLKIENTESTEDEIKRIKKHIASLISYEKSLQYTYEIDFSYSASRFASNVEIELVSDDAELVIEDGYIKKNIPYTETPRTETGFFPASGYTLPVHDVDMRSTYMRGRKVYSGTKNRLNVGVIDEVFDKRLYLVANSELVSFKFTFTAKELLSSQNLSLKVNLLEAEGIDLKE